MLDPEKDHFAKTLAITEHELTEEKLDEAFRRSIERFEGPFESDQAFTAHLDKHPRYFHVRVRLRLSRYMRNYYFALRGHQFKDSFLDLCFKNVEQDETKGASELAKNNIRLFLAQEKKLKKELEKERKKLVKSSTTY